jgi:hypothetical protein
MVWSFSDARLFRKCQRQWYYKHYVANARAKDQIRREAYYLSKLQAIPAWRGSIVDDVISNDIIPELNQRRLLRRQIVLQKARQLFSQQLAFAKQKRIREPGMTQKTAGRAFAALYPFDYGDEITDEELNQAWNDIENALSNFLEMEDIVLPLREATYLVAQRSLMYSFDSISIRAVPDLICFFSNQPPLIIDWKVHSYAMQNYRLQLACYATALIHCDPHKDFPTSLAKCKPTDIRLLEAQLLTRVPRFYTITDSDIEGVLSHITRTAREMNLAVDADPSEPLSPVDFPVALDSDECQRCSFRSLCWETI